MVSKLIYSESTSYVGDTLTDSAELEGNDAEDLKAPIVVNYQMEVIITIARMILMKKC